MFPQVNVARHQRLGPGAGRQGRGRTGHQPSLVDDLEPSGTGHGQSLLCPPQRDDMEVTGRLAVVELAGERVRLVGRRRVGVGRTGEVDEVAGQAAPHGPVGGHGGVVAAGKEHQGAPAGPDGTIRRGTGVWWRQAR